MLRGKARRDDPLTSQLAARGLSSSKLSGMHRRIVNNLLKNGDATVEEVSHETGINQQSLTPRFIELMRLGLIVCKGEKHTRKNSSGKKAMLWRIATEKESRYLKDYVGNGFLSAAAVLDIILKRMKNTKAPLHEDSLRAIRKYRKGFVFNTLLKKHGIKKFMKRYDTKGRPRHEG